LRAAKATLSLNATVMVKDMTKHLSARESGALRILFIEQLSALIGKTATTIRTCATNAKYQHLIPTPFKLPHSRRLCWYEDDVLRWIESTRPAEPPPARRPRGRPTKVEQLARARWAQTAAASADAKRGVE
jgi:predicted DNA-binding transcriptional regulator AlpA